MTLLGQFALWAAFLLGLWGVGDRASRGGGRTGPSWPATVTRSVYAVFGCLVVASIALWKGLISHDFNIEYVAAYTSRNLPPYYIVSAFWAGQKGSLLFWAVVLSLFASLAQLLTPRRYADLMPVRRGRDLGGRRVLRQRHAVRLPTRSSGWPSRPPTAGASIRSFRTSGMVIHPPMLYLGYISITIPFAFADRRAALPAARHRLDPRHPQVDAGVLALPLDRHHARHVVGVRRAGLGRLLGLGSGGERELPALAHHDRVPALGHDPGEARACSSAGTWA